MKNNSIVYENEWQRIFKEYSMENILLKKKFFYNILSTLLKLYSF